MTDEVRRGVRILGDTAPAERWTLLGLAYRMLGSVHDAEDVVQEAYSRWYTMAERERRDIRSPIAWLSRVTSRICLDHLMSARVRREHYVGEWIPEPLRDHGAWTSAAGLVDDPADRMMLQESVSMGMLTVLETITPAERVVFVLHDVFGMPFTEIAEVAGRSPAACRQLAVSARRRLAGERARPANDVERHREVISAFRRACESGDINALVATLDHGVVVHSDGGGRAHAALRPVAGARKAARLFLGLLRKQPGMEFSGEDVNGRPGAVIRRGGVTVAVIATETRGEVLTRMWMVVNPDKLHAWTGQGAGRTTRGLPSGS
ncbi:RNA polymerase sigma factor SigJ [Streptosporangium sp. NPDC023963]|uniref:RNA polymerase sigma factor SigJ n=1 Tax=Streptosporangium sp. NPDC023963 TaxID=3155608 RepID=UPI00341E0DF7